MNYPNELNPPTPTIAMNVCPNCKQSHDSTACPTPNAEGLGAMPGSAFPVVIDPDYAAFLTKSRIIAKQEGYAIAIHGSLTRDFDLVAIPWIQDCRKPVNLVTRLCFNTGWKTQDGDPIEREHGRLVWSLIREEFGDPRFIDFSVMPAISSQNK